MPWKSLTFWIVLALAALLDKLFSLPGRIWRRITRRKKR